MHNNLEITRLLIENDCDVNKSDNDFRTALFYAIYEAKEDIAIFLVLYGADINISSKQGLKPIDFANEKLKMALIEIYNEISGRNDEEEKNKKEEEEKQRAYQRKSIFSGDEPKMLLNSTQKMA